MKNAGICAFLDQPIIGAQLDIRRASRDDLELGGGNVREQGHLGQEVGGDLRWPCARAPGAEAGSGMRREGAAGVQRFFFFFFFFFFLA